MFKCFVLCHSLIFVYYFFYYIDFMCLLDFNFVFDYFYVCTDLLYYFLLSLMISLLLFNSRTQTFYQHFTTFFFKQPFTLIIKINFDTDFSLVYSLTYVFFTWLVFWSLTLLFQFIRHSHFLIFIITPIYVYYTLSLITLFFVCRVYFQWFMFMY